jgi:carbonic anhydrase/acetyltransferase-like protein (isoleucine patch superfamily)
MGSIILDGASIGQHSIVGAGSLVTGNKKFPSGVLILGSPAKVIRKLTEDEKNNIKKSAEHYVDIAKIYMK